MNSYRPLEKARVEGKCRNGEGHDLWYRPGPPAEFRQIPMHCLLYRSRQQQHLMQWLQTLGALKKCSGLQQLTPNPDYRCAWCRGTARPIDGPIDGRPQSEVQVGPDKLEVVTSFCYQRPKFYRQKGILVILSVIKLTKTNL